MFHPPTPEYAGPAAHDSGPGNKPISRIVLHSTVSPCAPGGARAVANYFRSEASRGSAHYVVDPAETLQCVYDGTIAWHAPPNPHSLGIEMCDLPSQLPGRWLDKNHRAMLRRVVHLTAQLCLAYDVPPTFLTVAELQAGKRGITTHNNVSLAFGESTHWDPGAWPQVRFMRRVRRRIRRIRKGSQR